MCIRDRVDAYDEDELRYLDALINLYTQIGYPCFKVSAKNGTGVAEIKKALEGRDVYKRQPISLLNCISRICISSRKAFPIPL